MPVTRETFKIQGKDYVVARWEDEQLVMEPFCQCGNALNEDYFCERCTRECQCTIIACSDPQALSVAEKMVQGHPHFKNYRACLLGGDE